jgi:hypothetical protein
MRAISSSDNPQCSTHLAVQFFEMSHLRIESRIIAGGQRFQMGVEFDGDVFEPCAYRAWASDLLV